MFDYIFQTKLATISIAITLACLVSIMIGRGGMWWRLILFNYAPTFACAFFIVAIFYDGNVNRFDILAGLIFELSILFVSAVLLFDVLKRIKSSYDVNTEQWLRWSFVIQLSAIAPIFIIDRAGIFSDDSRITYILENSLARHLSYAGLLISYMQAGFLAHRLSNRQSLGMMGYTIILTSFTATILSGSKGAAFLWLLAALALIDFKNIKIRWVLVFAVLVTVTIALWLTASVISSSIGITEFEFLELSFLRFFLNNDARALAIDFGGHADSFSNLPAASFRVVVNLLGYPSNDPPLGLLLNELNTGFSTDTGPNSSLIALILYYSVSGYALIPALVSCLGVACLYAVTVKFRHFVRSKLSKMAISIIGIVLIQLFSQDFLAFPLGVVSACAAGLLFLIIDRKRPRVTTRNFKSTTTVATS